MPRERATAFRHLSSNGPPDPRDVSHSSRANSAKIGIAPAIKGRTIRYSLAGRSVRLDSRVINTPVLRARARAERLAPSLSTFIDAACGNPDNKIGGNVEGETRRARSGPSDTREGVRVHPGFKETPSARAENAPTFE